MLLAVDCVARSIVAGNFYSIMGCWGAGRRCAKRRLCAMPPKQLLPCRAWWVVRVCWVPTLGVALGWTIVVVTDVVVMVADSYTLLAVGIRLGGLSAMVAPPRAIVRLRGICGGHRLVAVRTLGVDCCNPWLASADWL